MLTAVLMRWSVFVSSNGLFPFSSVRSCFFCFLEGGPTSGPFLCGIGKRTPPSDDVSVLTSQIFPAYTCLYGILSLANIQLTIVRVQSDTDASFLCLNSGGPHRGTSRLGPTVPQHQMEVGHSFNAKHRRPVKSLSRTNC